MHGIYHYQRCNNERANIQFPTQPTPLLNNEINVLIRILCGDEVKPRIYSSYAIYPPISAAHEWYICPSYYSLK